MGVYTNRVRGISRFFLVFALTRVIEDTTASVQDNHCPKLPMLLPHLSYKTCTSQQADCNRSCSTYPLARQTTAKQIGSRNPSSIDFHQESNQHPSSPLFRLSLRQSSLPLSVTTSTNTTTSPSQLRVPTLSCLSLADPAQKAPSGAKWETHCSPKHLRQKTPMHETTNKVAASESKAHAKPDRTTRQFASFRENRSYGTGGTTQRLNDKNDTYC